MRCSSCCGLRPVADPTGDLENFKLELLVADRDHVERRLERVEKQAKSGDAKLRAEVEELRKVLAFADGGHSLDEYPGELPGELEPLTTKPSARDRERPWRDRPEARGRARRAARRGGRGLPRRRRVGARRHRRAAPRRARPDHVLHRRRAGHPRLDAPQRRDRARRRGGDPLRHRARLHPLRGGQLARPRRARFTRRGRARRQAEARRQDVRRPGRRRPEHPLQHLRRARPGTWPTVGSAAAAVAA